MQESTITSKGQTTLPRDVRRALDLQAGDRIRYVVEGGEVRILPVRKLGELRGIIKTQHPVSLDKMDAAIRDGAIGS